MNSTASDESTTNPYERAFDELIRSAASVIAASEAVAESYLGGKPRTRGKHKVTSAERDMAFWTSGFLYSLPAVAWQSESLVLALARYLGQERVANPALLESIAAAAPETIHRAVRYSCLVLNQHSPRRTELDRLAHSASGEFLEMLRVLDIFNQAFRERQSAVGMWKSHLADLSPLELLMYASLHAFENWVPGHASVNPAAPSTDSAIQAGWDAVNDLFIWKLTTAEEGSIALREEVLGVSLKAHLMPFLLPLSEGLEPEYEKRGIFKNLLNAQIELNNFIAQSANAFSYDDSIQFVRNGAVLEIHTVEPAIKVAWERCGNKLDRLHLYWFKRALKAFVDSGMAEQPIGKPENQDANLFAYVNALRTLLQLQEVYGLADFVTTDSGERADLFKSLLSLELMSAFFRADFLQPFAAHLTESGNPLRAAGRLALNGLASGGKNRFPLTWSNRESKVANITTWTVDADHPTGSTKMAAAILDFWSYDCVDLAKRLQNHPTALKPELTERPVLKFGQLLVQLPWIVAIQNNSTAALNNLRRVGARRGEAMAETQRVESRLGKLLQDKGFRVALNWEPPINDKNNPGEVDLICARDDLVLVLEVKSTYLRHSMHDAWLHRTTTLRRAGLQLKRKMEAVRTALITDTQLIASLGRSDKPMSPLIHGWIVDTSIECDHERFSGFLKVSFEEVLIALRDEAYLLGDPSHIVDESSAHADMDSAFDVDSVRTLYPDGFTASRFVEVVETEAVWQINVN